MIDSNVTQRVVEPCTVCSVSETITITIKKQNKNNNMQSLRISQVYLRRQPGKQESCAKATAN